MPKFIIYQFKWVLVPELNQGQLSKLLKAEIGIEVISYGKVQGLPFKVSEIVQKIHEQRIS